MFVLVVSKVPENYGATKVLEFHESDTIGNVIENIASEMDIALDTRMYLRLQNGTELSPEAQISEALK